MKLKRTLLVLLCACTFAFCGMFAPYTVSADNVNSTEMSVEDSVTESVEHDSTEETQPTDEEKMQAILELVGDIADEAGVGDKWEETLSQIKNAVDEKKIDLMTALYILQLAIFAVYAIYKVVKGRIKAKLEKDMPKNVQEIKTGVGAQTTAVNGLIDEQNKVNANVEKTNCSLQTLAVAGELQNQALRMFISGTQLTTETKESAYRALRKSDKEYEKIKGGV
jgi:hypothetical protein